MKRTTLIFALVFSAFMIMSSTIDLANLFNYENQIIPAYITKDNTPANNPITDEGATLGRVLFYDKKLSRNNTLSCANCHKQEFAFGDTATASVGVNGTTGRHSMRLVNARFGAETNFFWDERATSLEDQTSQPIQDHVEMGFSGTNGDPDLDSLRRKIASTAYYKDLFTLVYGDTIVTEQKIQFALAQFIRSIQSFDSKFDSGRALVANNNQPFPNYTQQENQGKALYLAPPQFDNAGNRIMGGAGCQGCHHAPEFDIDPNTGNNGVIGSFSGGVDFTNTRSPSLRDVVKSDGSANGPFMHTGASTNFITVLNHYDSIVVIPGNTTIDNRLVPGGNPQRLNLTNQEKNQLVAFIRTLAGSDIYTNPKWGNPFTNDSLTILNGTTSSIALASDNDIKLTVYPNPFTDIIHISYPNKYLNNIVSIYNTNGKLIKQSPIDQSINLSEMNSGVYLIRIGDQVKRIIKQ